MNIISFDIEEWACAKADGTGTPEKYSMFDRYLNRILDILDSYDTKATFFCTGMTAQEFPHVVKLIQSRGHEVGCHSHIHTWLNKMTEEECRKDTLQAVDSLEQCIGEKVISYRAPAFSIGEGNKWAFEILADNGIQNDASVFPAPRDFGGFPDFEYIEPVTIQVEEKIVREFPIPICSLMGRKIAFSGGGYLRLLPLWLIKKEMMRSNYGMVYLHIDDMLEEKMPFMSREEYEDYFKEEGTLMARASRYLKANIGRSSTIAKLEALLSSMQFVTVRQASMTIDWEHAGNVSL